MNTPDKQTARSSHDLTVRPPSSMPAVQPGPVLPPSSSDIDVVDTLQRRWIMSAGIFAVLMVTGFELIGHLVKPFYSAETTIYVSPSALKDNADHVNEISYATLINHQILTAQHYDTLSAAMRWLDATDEPWTRPGESEQEAIERMRSTISVWRLPDSYEITIGAHGQDPTHLAVIANAVAQAYLEKASGEFSTERADRMSVLTKESSFVQNELNQKLDQMQLYSGQLQVVDVQRASTFPVDSALSQMRVALAAAHQRRIEAEQRLAIDEPSNAAPEAEQVVMGDSALRTMMDNLLQKKFDLHTRLDGMRPANPLYKATAKEIGGVDGQLQSVPSEIVHVVGTQLMDKRHADLDEARGVEAALRSEIAQRQAETEKASREVRQARALNEDIERALAHQRDVEQHIDALKLQDEMPGFLRVFSTAQRPLVPLRDQKQKALGSLLVLAIAVSLLFPIAMDALDTRIYTPATVERVLGFLPIGMTIEDGARQRGVCRGALAARGFLHSAFHWPRLQNRTADSHQVRHTRYACQ